MKTWQPNLRGRVDEYVVRFLEGLSAKIDKMALAIESLSRKSGATPDLRSSLQAGGPTPLNVEGLLGHLAQPQTGGAPMLSANPASVDPLAQDGAIFVLSGSPNTLYRVNRSTEPPTFDPIGGSGSVTSVGSGTGLTGGPITGSGTLSVNASVVRSTATKVLGAPATDGYIDVTINGVSTKLMTTA